MANDETARVAALRRYRILDTEPEQQFDDLTLLASQVCGTPIALISLVDECRQWFKSRVGTTVGETSRSVSFCAYALGRPDLLIIPDARDDERFRDNPMVTGEPNVRFYAGAPLTSREGFTLGTLCVIDSVPRTLTDGQAAALQALRRQVEGQLELRRSLIRARGGAGRARSRGGGAAPVERGAACRAREHRQAHRAHSVVGHVRVQHGDPG